MTPAEDPADGTPAAITPVAGDSHLEPYERQPGESMKSYNLFCVYRDLGPRRSIKECCRRFYGADNCPGKHRWAAEWSRLNDWVRRAAAYDLYLDREGRLAAAEQVKEMNRRYATSAKALVGKALQALHAMTPAELDAGDITRFLEVANKIERLCHDQPTERTHTKAEVKTEGTATLEVVERIVLVRGDAPAAAHAPPAPPRPVAALAAAGEPADDAAEGEFVLPDEEPAPPG